MAVRFFSSRVGQPAEKPRPQKGEPAQRTDRVMGHRPSVQPTSITQRDHTTRQQRRGSAAAQRHSRHAMPIPTLLGCAIRLRRPACPTRSPWSSQSISNLTATLSFVGSASHAGVADSRSCVVGRSMRPAVAVACDWPSRSEVRDLGAADAGRIERISSVDFRFSIHTITERRSRNSPICPHDRSACSAPQLLTHAAPRRFAPRLRPLSSPPPSVTQQPWLSRSARIPFPAPNASSSWIVRHGCDLWLLVGLAGHRG